MHSYPQLMHIEKVKKDMNRTLLFLTYAYCAQYYYYDII